MTRQTRSPFARRRPGRYEVKALSQNEAEILLYQEIGYWGVSAEQFMQDLAAIEADTIHVRINSPGGDVFDGSAIYNALKTHDAEIITHVDGLAASYASVIALAGSKVMMADNAFLMIHDPWTLAIGDSAEMRKQANILDKIGGVIAQNYAEKTGKPLAEIQSLMASETWFTADEAVAAGLVDAVEGETDAPDALFDLSVFRHVPKNLQNSSRAMPDERTLEAALRDAGLSRKQASTVLSKGFDALHPRDAGDAAEFVSALHQANKQIRALI